MLDGIHNLLKLAGKDLENVTSQIEECGGLDKIESLQNHENVDIYKLAYEIIEKFFNDEVKATALLSFTSATAWWSAFYIFSGRSHSSDPKSR